MMSATQSWFGPSGAMLLGRFGKIRRSIAIGGGDEAPAPTWLKAMLAHQASDFLVVTTNLRWQQRCLHAAVVTGFEALEDRGHRPGKRRVVGVDDWRS